MHKVRTAPLNVVIIADGEDALRLHKRVSCAARAHGIALTIESQRANGDEPRVLIDDSVLAEGLPRTEDIEQRLAEWLAATETT